MEEYGKTVRQIRLNKGFSQKEVYTGIASKSFAIEFEKGRHDIKFELMLEILERLMVGVKEFLFIHKGYKNQDESDFFVDEKMNFNNGTLEDYQRIERKLVQKVLERKVDKIVLIRFRLMILVKKCNYMASEMEKEPEYPELKEALLKYLYSFETWTLSELQIFINHSYLFHDTKEMKILYLRAWKNVEKYKYHDDYNELMGGLLVNYFYSFILLKDWAMVEQILEKLDEVSQDFQEVWIRLVYKGYLAFAMSERGEKEKAKTELENVLEILDFLDYQEFSTQVRRMLGKM